MPFIRSKKRNKPQRPQQAQSKYTRPMHPYQMSESYKMYFNGGPITAGFADSLLGTPTNLSSDQSIHNLNPTYITSNQAQPPVPTQGFNFGNLGATGAAGVSTGALGIAGNIANLIMAPGQIKKQKAEQEAAMADIDQFFAKEKKGLYDTKLNQALADAYSFGVRATDTSGAQAAAQTALGAASADPRVAAGMINQIQSNLGGQMLGAAQADAAKEQQQMLGLGQIKQQLGAEATAFDKQLGLQKLGEDKLAYNTAKQNEEAIRAARRAIPGQMVGDATNIALTLASKGVFAQGGQMTPGDFNHETNPIHMVDDNGNKVGEATGGEFILNPEQSDTIEDAYEKIEDKRKANKEITQDDLMYLYEAVRSIFSQPQFND